eukprot:9407283-Pyramimonas_sp.AAC.1
MKLEGFHVFIAELQMFSRRIRSPLQEFAPSWNLARFFRALQGVPGRGGSGFRAKELLSDFAATMPVLAPRIGPVNIDS